MSNTDTSIDALLARPPEQLSGGEVTTISAALLNAVSLLEETQLYENAVSIGKRDAKAGHALLMKQGDLPDFEPAFPMVRLGLLAWFSSRMDVIEGVVETRDLLAVVNADLPGGPADRAREAAFRREPGRFLPGATRSAVTLFRAPGFAMIRLDDVDLPWTYAAVGKGRSDFAELYAVVEEGGYQGGVLVGPAAVAEEVSLPEGYEFVAVDLSNGGRAA
ncbi:hypothetical protein MKK68_01985 [Methylobacterium sp. E-016]|uniref:hypothetical protein n=1 Tax=Methylobacterium sp. E-016 TaxID=2836556 RepID=UPI001FBACBD7|nr:hypothetical protein [Methylobacterium sp. E-016]MCJ2074432.1 hypothetical protein [Methylobacterium sp. E-016]